MPPNIYPKFAFYCILCYNILEPHRTRAYDTPALEDVEHRIIRAVTVNVGKRNSGFSEKSILTVTVTSKFYE